MTVDTDITIVITAHREGVLAGVSLRSALDAAEVAAEAGVSCELVAILDRADDDTRAIFDQSLPLPYRVEEVHFGDQGLARNRAAELARGDLVALLDADDLWSRNWLAAAHAFIRQHGEQSICHPEVNWFFGESNNLFFHIDQLDADFDSRMLRFVNCWDSLCVAVRRVFEEIPYDRRDLENGFAYEDWQWNCETLEAGYVHRVVPGTIHFKRRRRSQNMAAASSGALVRRTAAFRYGWQTHVP